jgi:hypothetical protein
MNPAAEKIVAVLRGLAPGAVPTSAVALRNLADVPIGAFAGAITSLRYAGKMEWDSFRLTPATAEPSPTPSLKQEVDAEASRAGANRTAARSTGSVVGRRGAIAAPTPDGLSLGGALQDVALRDDPLGASSILRARWSPLWLRICAYAKLTHQRPVIAMLSLIEAGLLSFEDDVREEAA